MKLHALTSTRGATPAFFLVVAFLSLGCCPTSAFAQVSTEWVVTYNGSANSQDYGYRLALDGENNVYIAGATVALGAAENFLLLKYNSAGDLLWEAQYDGPAHGSDQVTDLAVDSQGYALVTGPSQGASAGDQGYDYATLKYSPSGVQQWVARYDGPGNDLDWPFALVTDDSGNVFVTGKSTGAGTGLDMTTLKYNASGQQQWVSRFNGSNGFPDEARALALDAAGNVCVTGSRFMPYSSADFATFKYNPSGQQQWFALYGATSSDWDVATEIATDAAGYVYISGSSHSLASQNDYVTIKYSPNGGLQWTQWYNDLANGVDTPAALALDDLGFVYVTGVSAGELTGDDAATLKYAPDGGFQWEMRFDGFDHLNDYPSAMVLDSLGDLYITGSTTTNQNSTDCVTLKYDPSGQVLWMASYDGPSQWTDHAKDLAVDCNGNVYVTGYCDNLTNGYDVLLIKYHQASPSPVNLTLDPINPPIQIPAQGGTFYFNIIVSNQSTQPQTFDAWCRIQLPDSTWHGPVIGPLHLTLPVGAGISRLRYQFVPPNAPAGNYAYCAYLGLYPDLLWDQDSFPFTKLGFRDGGLGVSNWENSGEPLNSDEKITYNSSLITSNLSPNPFNPTTILSFELRATSFVELDVFDVTGRVVGVKHFPNASPMMEKWYESGAHQILFDGSGLPSGIYLARLQVGDQMETRKLVLLK